MKLTYPALFYPCAELSGGYTVEVPDLPGCVTQGSDLADAIFMAEDAASGWILDELEEGRKLPQASSLTEIKAEGYKNGFVSLLALDMDAYAEKYGKKAVRKNLTIPAWLNTAAEKAHINFSEVLQRALEKEVFA
ncbi:MAG: type II toxin-antitoxin system HicB family antitoxin [Pyramidobacter sp.]|nr:type II toxin-antitoxin system HicB family antitoxin [Pyramidobacter sp.]